MSEFTQGIKDDVKDIFGKSNAVGYDQLIEQITKLQEDFYTTGFDPDGALQLLFPTKEAMKKMLMMQNPHLTRYQVDMMIDSKAELQEKFEKRENKKADKEERKKKEKEKKQNLTPEEQKKKDEERAARKAKRKAEMDKKINEYKEVFKNKMKELRKQAKRLKDTIREQLHALWTAFVDIVKRLFKSIVKTVSGIVGIIIIFSAPPWNVPNGIKQITDIIEDYLNILSAIKAINPYLRVFLLLPLVCPKENLKIIGKIFKPIIQGFRAFWIPIKILSKLISSVLDWLGKFLSRRRESIFRKVTRKLKKLGHLYRLWLFTPKGELLFPPERRRGDYYPVDPADGRDYPCYSWDEDDVEEIQGYLDTYIVGYEGNKTANRVVAYRRKFSPEGKELADAAGKFYGENIDFDSFDFEQAARDFDELDRSVPNLESIEQLRKDGQFSDDGIEDTFIYDIELPDGTIIQNISEAGIEYYRENYILKYLNAATQSYKEAITSI